MSEPITQSRSLVTQGDLIAERLLGFIETLRLPQGQTFGSLFATDPWLRDNIFKPALARTSTGLPRQQLLWLELVKGALKTSCLAALGLAEGLMFDGTEIFVVAADSDQAAHVMEAAASMVDQSPRLQQVVRQTKLQFSLPGRSFIKVQSSDERSLHGLAATARHLRLYADECTNWLDRDLFDGLLSHLPKIRDSQMIVATNAGISDSWQGDARAQFEDSGAYLFVTPSGWLPSWTNRATVNLAAGAMERGEFRRRWYNEWHGAADSLVSVQGWDACKGDVPPYAGDEIIVAIDAGLKHDTFAICAVTRDPRPGNCPCGVGGDHPRREHGIAVREVQVWTPPKGGNLDFDAPFRWLEEYVKTHHYVEMIVYDPWQIADSMRRFREATNIACKPFDQGAPRAKADTLLALLIDSGRILHDGDPVLAAHIGNAVYKVSKGQEGRGRLEKKRKSTPIDAAVALSMAADTSLYFMF